MSAEISNLVCDAVPDPPRFCENTNLKEQIRSQEQKIEETPPNPEINNDSNKLNHQRSRQENDNASDDQDSSQEKEQEKKKPKSNQKRKSRKSSSGGPTVINNIVKDCSNIYMNFSTQNTINIKTNGGSTSKRDRRSSEEKCKKMPPHIEKLAEVNLRITVTDKLKIKQNIGENWKKAARKLGFNKSEVEQKAIDYDKSGIGEVMFQILTAWEQRQGQNATLGALMKALWASQEYDCVEELALIHGSNN